MCIKRIKLENFKSFFAEAVLQLSSETNIIVGKNGSGKSSIVTAICFVMCGKKFPPGESVEFIYENGQLGGESTSVEILFDNSSGRFSASREFSVRRTVGVGRDEYVLDGKNVSVEEFAIFLRNAGFIVDDPYFIVCQGEVSELAVLDESGRYDLIKKAVGVFNYEEDRRMCVKMLDEAEGIEDKVGKLLDRIDDRFLKLEGKRKEMEVYDELEGRKKRLEYAYVEREVCEINGCLLEIEELLLRGEGDEDEEFYEDVYAEDIGDEIERLLRRRNELTLDEGYRGKAGEVMKEMEEAKAVECGLRAERCRDEEKLGKLKREEGLCFIKLNYFKYLCGFLGTFDGRTVSTDEMEAVRSLLERKTSELEQSKDSNVEGCHLGSGESGRDLESLIERRKFLWREEKMLEESARSTAGMLKSQGNKFLLSEGGVSFAAYQQVKDEDGVLGCVCDLVTMPDELMDAFEAATGATLFNVVVRDENVASEILAKVGCLMSGVTFMPLNRIRPADEERVKDPMVISLSSRLQCDPEYKPLLRYITRDSYLCSDLQSAVSASRRYNINVVTLEGDVVSKRGSISGGYERKRGLLRGYKSMCHEERQRCSELEDVRRELRRINHDICDMKMETCLEGG